ncbi:MAG: hypothetical protein WCS03_14145 [Bacteroidota bacterium]
MRIGKGRKKAGCQQNCNGSGNRFTRPVSTMVTIGVLLPDSFAGTQKIGNLTPLIEGWKPD